MPQNCDQGLLDSLITFSDTSWSSLKELETKVLSQIAIKKSNLFRINAALYFSINHCVIRRIKVNIGTKWDQGKWMHCTAWAGSVFRVFLARIFPHSDARKYGPEKLRKRTLFTKCWLHLKNHFLERDVFGTLLNIYDGVICINT